MLIAMADSQLVNATELIRQKTIPKQLVCPCCQQPVIYKHGDRRIAHFSHKSNAVCAGFSEGESQAHLKGKLAFKQQLEKMGQAAVLEYHLPTIEQRADVLLPDQQLILEYQCSPISYNDISRRTSNYKSLGYDVLWILGDRHLNAVNRLDGIAKFARFQPRLGFFVVYYSADRQQLKLHYHIQKLLEKWSAAFSFSKVCPTSNVLWTAMKHQNSRLILSFKRVNRCSISFNESIEVTCYRTPLIAIWLRLATNKANCLLVVP